MLSFIIFILFLDRWGFCDLVSVKVCLYRDLGSGYGVLDSWVVGLLGDF